MRAGRLDNQIVLQSRSVSQDPNTGEPTNSWSTYATVWATVSPLKGDERFKSARDIATKAYKFTLRYRSDVTPQDRIVFRSENYDIVGISPLGRRNKETLEIVAEVEESTSGS